MNEKELQRIFDLFNSLYNVEGGNFTFEIFTKGMSTSAGRLKFWNDYKKTLGLIKDFKQFEKSLINSEISYYKPEKRIPSTDMPDFKSRDCDENTYNWGYGCRNNKIGALNNKFFGNKFDGKYGDELLTKLRNIGSLGPKDSYITKEIFDKLLPNYDVVEESLIIKKTVKNILLNELLKDI
jgi:hypothetical protein